MHQSSLEHMRLFRDRYLAARDGEPLRILDIGSRDVTGLNYRSLFDMGAWKYVGVDLEAGANVDLVLADPYRWREIASESCDAVISGQAFEHIEYPWVTILEIARVLKPGGLVCLIAPSGGPQHRYPVDCWRFFPDGVTALARWARLDVLEIIHRDDNGPWSDDSDQWRDTVLIARKPVWGFWRSLRRGVRLSVYSYLLNLAVPRSK